MNSSSPSPVGSEDRRSNNFDLLRLLAAWLVLFSHCYPLSGQPVADPFARTFGIDTLGGIGVAMFFVISGYLVTLSRQRANGILDFAGRRGIRIFPALIVLTLLAVLVLGPVFTTLPLAAYFKNPQTWDYLRNMVPWTVHFALPGTFATNPAAHAVNGSLWSLPYEIRCYLALVLLWLLPLRHSWIAVATAAVLTLLLAARPDVPPASAFDKHLGVDYYTAKLGLFFAIGACFALLAARPRWMIALCLAGFPAMALVAPGNLQTTFFVYALAGLILWLGIAIPLPKLPARMGDWSYGLYLYGFPVQQMVATVPELRSNLPLFVLLTTLLAMSSAGLSWFLIEQPALRWYRRRTARGPRATAGARAEESLEASR